MTERFTEIASTKYIFHTNNCVNAVQETMKAGGLSNPAIDCIKNTSKLQPHPIFSVLIKKTYPNISLLNYTTIKLFYNGTEYEKKVMKSWRKILNNLLHRLFGIDPQRIDWAKYKAHYFIIIYYTGLCWFVMDEYKITGHQYLDLELLYIA